MTLYLRWNYFFIPLVIVGVLWLGGLFTSVGIESGWYENIYRPVWTPPPLAFSGAWITIFALFAISALIIWNSMPRTGRFLWIGCLFLLSLSLNLLWSYFFFVEHNFALAIVDAALLALAIALAVLLLWGSARWSAIFLLPYLFWVIFATYLTYAVSLLN